MRCARAVRETWAVGRARASAGPRRGGATRARAAWKLDKHGCADGDDLSGDTIWEIYFVQNQHKSATCLPEPIDVDELMRTREGKLRLDAGEIKFVDAEADGLVIEALDGVTVIDGKRMKKGERTKARSGSAVWLGKEEFSVYKD